MVRGQGDVGMRPAIASLAFLGLAGCATVINGSTQDVTVRSEPIGAACQVLQHGYPIGNVTRTPGMVKVTRGGGDLEVDCRWADGRTGRSIISGHMATATMGNAVLGGLIGLEIDEATGDGTAYADPLIRPGT